MRGKILDLWFPLALVVGMFAIFGKAFSYGFFQDDYLLLFISRASSFSEWISFIMPIEGFPYRPLATHYSFWVFQQFLPLNSYVYHWINFFWLGLNTYLAHRILKILFKEKWVARYGTVLYALSAVHYMSLFWIATLYFMQGTTFFFLGFELFVRWRDTLLATEGMSWKRWGMLLGVYLIGSLFNETVLFLPIILIVYEYLGSKSINRLIKRLILFGGVGIILLGFRLVTAGPPAAEDYHLVFAPFSIIKTMMWYVWRVIGLPEGIRVAENASLLYLLSFGFVGGLVFFYGLTNYQSTKRLKHKSIGSRLINQLTNQLINFTKSGVFGKSKSLTEFSTILFGLSWFIIGLIPFMFLPNHMSSYYLEISLLGMVIGLMVLVRRLADWSIGRLVLVGVLGLYVLQSYLSVQAMDKSHWVSHRGALGNRLFALTQAYCNEPIEPDFSEYNQDEVTVILSSGRAEEVICLPYK